ncbi:MAG: hypothetical protein ABSF73_02960 [Terriglobia bacterium]|jgi:hypothetical protein
MTNLFLYLAFVGGEILHVLKRASLAAQSTTNHYTILSYIKFNWPVFLVRGALGLVLFSLWLHSPAILSFLGLTVPTAFPETKAVAFGFGYFADSFLDYVGQKIPWWGREVPTAN